MKSNKYAIVFYKTTAYYFTIYFTAITDISTFTFFGKQAT